MSKDYSGFGQSQIHGCPGPHQEVDFCSSLHVAVILSQVLSLCQERRILAALSLVSYDLQSKRKRDHLSTITIYFIYPNLHASDIAGVTFFHLHDSHRSRREECIWLDESGHVVPTLMARVVGHLDRHISITGRLEVGSQGTSTGTTKTMFSPQVEKKGSLAKARFSYCIALCP